MKEYLGKKAISDTLLPQQLISFAYYLPVSGYHDACWTWFYMAAIKMYYM